MVGLERIHLEGKHAMCETKWRGTKDVRDSSLGRVLLLKSVRFVQARVAIFKE
jgi:hypothetical protein